MNLHERLQQIGNWLERLFLKIPKEIKLYAREAHKITTSIKEMLDSGVVKMATDFIPGTWDDEIRIKAVGILNQLILIFIAIEGDDEPAKKAKNAIVAKMASELIAIQDKHELPENRYDLYQQLSYSAEVKKFA